MTEHYFYRGTNLVTTLQPFNNTTVFSHDRKTMAFLKASPVQPSIALVAVDSQRSPAQCNSMAANQQIIFSVYGHAPGNNLMPVAFKGERLDPLSCSYLLGMGYRSYSPVLMRFASPDVDSPFDRGGLNPYAFVLGDPVNYSDPDGHGIGVFIQPQLKIVRPYTTFGKPRRDNKHLKDIVVTSGREFGQSEYTMDVIFGHGDGTKVGGLTPTALKEQLKANNAPLSKGPIHLIACMAGATAATHGDGFPKVAYGQKFANIMKRPVTTYTEPVIFDLGLNPSLTMIDLELQESSYLFSNPVTFYPDKRGKESGSGLLRRLVSNLRA